MFAVIVLLACAATPEAEAPWTEPDSPGPYSAGVSTMYFISAAGKSLVAEVWYPTVPTDAPGDPYPELAITRAAHRDAELDIRAAPYPMVAFSHGSGGIRYQSAFLTEYLAEHGYVVVAVDHVGNTLFDYETRPEVEIMLERPSDVVQAVNELIERAAQADGVLAGVTQDGPYAMIGHSFGAHTAMAVAGGQADFEAFKSACSEVDRAFCGMADDIADGAVLADAPDPRAAVVVPMAAGGWYGFGERGEGLATLAPALFWGGTLDESTPWEEEGKPAYLAASTPKSAAVLTDAGHFVYSDLCSVAPFYSDECDPENGYVDVELAHSMIQTITTAWIDVHLLGESRSEPWLQADRWEQPVELMVP